ncbi:MAG TPA: DAK2 domain-containing protein [Acidimicrobiales bacterium]|nr:DAK2 domain-containing protein [Acidimicrobiales bacterium]
MGVIDTLEAGTLGQVIGAYRDALRSHQDVINRLNVYPVPDGDTGTNMALTIESVVAELDKLDHPDMAVTSKAIAHGSLMGARGNSGVILSQLLRGIVDGLNESGLVPGPKDLARALTVADELARAAVMRPVEGTILTVARAAAEGARAAADAGKALVDVVGASRSAAAEALARTPELLPILAQAGVVDAGGAGYLLLFDAILSVVDGRPLPEPPDLPDPPTGWAREHPAIDEAVAASHDGGSGDISGLRYEVMYLLEARDDTIPSFKEVWAGVGDSIVVVGGDGLWNCHIHTDNIGAAVEASLDAGRPRNIRVTDLLEQVEEERWVREGGGTAGSGAPESPPGPPPTTGVVAVSSGVGIGRIFRSLGVHQVIAGGQSMNPSTAEILEAVEQLRTDEVIILPNNKNIRPVAERIDDLTGKMVRVVPTNNIAEGFAALLAYDPEAHVDVNARDMESSARNVVAGEITQAVRDSDSAVGKVAVGDWIGLSRQGIEAVSNSVSQVAHALLDKLVTDDHELVTLIEGEGSTAADTRRITEWLGEHRPGVDIEVHRGGQPLYPYLFSIE